MLKYNAEKITPKDIKKLKKEYDVVCKEIYKNFLEFRKVKDITVPYNDQEIRKRKNLILEKERDELFSKKRSLIFKINNAEELSALI